MWIARLIILSFSGSVYCQTDVRLPPTIIQDPARTYIYRQDGNAQLNCRAYGIPAVDYEWRKNGGELNLNLNNIRRIADGTIEIKPITSLDEGYYQCFAKNQYGTAMSNTSFLQMAVHVRSQQTNVLPMTVTEGDPFVVRMQPVKSVPSATYEWESAIDAVDKTPNPLTLSKRMQISENGDLHFAYAIRSDNLGGRIYKSTVYNEYLDIRSVGSYTSVTVTQAVGGPKQFPPTISFSSPQQTIAVEGDTVSLRCFFSGNPEPNIQWNGPKNSLPAGRYEYKNDNSMLELRGIQKSDEGDYACTGTNALQTLKHTLQIKVEAKPKFLNFKDRPHDTNITEGSSISFDCRASAVPEATVTWFRNGKPLDVEVPPKRFSFSKDRKTLTIQNLCRNCDDRPDTSQSDLGIVQCNASNVHGYAFGAGYINVLAKTQATIIADSTKVDVEINVEKRVEFLCQVTSDPLTPVVPVWYLEMEDHKGRQMVKNEPPVVLLNGGQLIIHVIPNNTKEWEKHDGFYKCTANNTYSYAEATAEIKIVSSPAQKPPGFETYWWILLLILLLLLLIIIIICIVRCQRRKRGDKYNGRQALHPTIENPPAPQHRTVPLDTLPTSRTHFPPEQRAALIHDGQNNEEIRIDLHKGQESNRDSSTAADLQPNEQRQKKA